MAIDYPFGILDLRLLITLWYLKKAENLKNQKNNQ
jgi:hypothetical protein